MKPPILLLYMIPFCLTSTALAFLNFNTAHNVTILEMIFNVQRKLVFLYCYRYPFRTWTPPTPKIVGKRERHLVRVHVLRALTSYE